MDFLKNPFVCLFVCRIQVRRSRPTLESECCHVIMVNRRYGYFDQRFTCRSTPTQALCGQCCGSSPIQSRQIPSMTGLSAMCARYTCAETIRVLSDPNSRRFFSRTASVSLVCPSMSSVVSIAVATVHTRSLYADAAFRPIYFPLTRVIIMFLQAKDLSTWITWEVNTLN